MNIAPLDFRILRLREKTESWAVSVLSNVLSDCGGDAVDRALEWVWNQSAGRYDIKVMIEGLKLGIMYNIRDPINFISLLNMLQYLENLPRIVKRLESDQNLLRELRAYACGERKPG